MLSKPTLQQLRYHPNSLSRWYRKLNVLLTNSIPPEDQLSFISKHFFIVQITFTIVRHLPLRQLPVYRNHEQFSHQWNLQITGKATLQNELWEQPAKESNTMKLSLPVLSKPKYPNSNTSTSIRHYFIHLHIFLTDDIFLKLTAISELFT